MISVPFSRHAWSPVVPLLYIGGHRYIGFDRALHNVVVRNEFDLVLSFHQQFGAGPDRGIERRYADIPDGKLTREHLEKVREFTQLGVNAIRCGRTVLARCHAGYNRSGLLAGFILLKLGHTSDEAIRLIRDARGPHALCNPLFVDLIHAEAEPAPTIGPEVTV